MAAYHHTHYLRWVSFAVDIDTKSEERADTIHIQTHRHNEKNVRVSDATMIGTSSSVPIEMMSPIYQTQQTFL